MVRVSRSLAALKLQWAFGALYDYTDTRNPQISVSDRTFDASGLRATDTIK
jgi:hypothetical protein